MKGSGCIFCKILAGESEGTFVFKGKRCSAIMDINPLSTGHVLVVANTHVENLADLDGQTACDMFALSVKLLRALKSSEVPMEGANLFVNDGRIAGQEVFHVHMHIVPRFSDDGLEINFNKEDKQTPSRDQLQETAALIRSAFKALGD